MFDKMWKRALLVTAVGLSVAAVTGGQLGAQGRPIVVAPAGDGVHVVDQTQAILYDQYDNQGANALTSQNFEAVYDAYDSFLADDFVIPNGVNWVINQIDVDGVYSVAGPAASFNVFLHRHVPATNLPFNSPTAQKLNRPYTVVGASTFRINLMGQGNTIRISANQSRHWWISVQANLDFDAGAGGQWFWTDRSVQSNAPSAWKNPGDGFGTGCTTYSNMNTCLAQLDPDLMFTLYGNAI